VHGAPLLKGVAILQLHRSGVDKLMLEVLHRAVLNA
jgi:hypothetical protein